MRVIETEVYHYEELNEKAKERARDWYRGCAAADVFDDSAVLDDFKVIAGLLGFENVKPVYSGWGCQGDGASFIGTWSAATAAKGFGKVLEHAPKDEVLHKIAGRIQKIATYYPTAIATIVRNDSRYSHEHTVGYEIGDGEDWPELSVGEGSSFDIFCLTSRDLMRWLYQQLTDEHDYVNSDDAVADTIMANDYEFTIDGRHFREIVKQGS